MQYRVVEQHRYAPNCKFVLGGASWDQNVDVIALKWLDKNGNFSRAAGEMDDASLLQAIEMAVREGLIKAKDAIESIAAGMK